MPPVFQIHTQPFYALKCDEIYASVPKLHKNIEIIYVLDGCIDIEINGGTYHLKPGDLCLTFPYVIHGNPYKRLSHLLIGFDPDLIQDFSPVFQSKLPISPCLSGDDMPSNIPDILNRIVTVFEGNSLFRNELLKGYLSAVIGELLSVLPLDEVKSQTISTVQEILIYCSANFRNKITLKQISDDLHISENHISAIFSKKIKLPLRSYINNLRIHEAMFLLLNTEMDITDIMFHCGFTNQSTFNKVFMELCGTTPRQFRKSRSY